MRFDGNKAGRDNNLKTRKKARSFLGMFGFCKLSDTLTGRISHKLIVGKADSTHLRSSHCSLVTLRVLSDRTLLQSLN